MKIDVALFNPVRVALVSDVCGEPLPVTCNARYLNQPTADERYHKRRRNHGSGGKHHFASDYHGVVSQRAC